MIPNTRRLIFNILAYVKNGPVLSSELSGLMHTQWLAPEEIQLLQWKKVKKLLAIGSTEVPYYRKQFHELRITHEDIRSWDDYKVLPVVRKEDLKRDPEAFKRQGLNRDRFVIDCTGGSTGKPTLFYRDKEKIGLTLAYKIRNWQWCGYTIGQPHALVWGTDRDILLSRRFEQRLKNYLLNQVWLDAFSLTREKSADFMRILKKRRTALISGYPSSLLEFSRFVRELEPDLTVPAIVTTAEKLTTEMRQEIERSLHGRVFDRYGCRELDITAHECEAHQGLHVNDEHVLFEIINRDADGAGEVVYTDLDNTVFPFIRYAVEDTAAAVPGKCPCGRGLSRINVASGRISDIVNTPSGVKVHGEYFSHLFYGYPKIRRFQVVQSTSMEIIVRLDIADGAGEIEAIRSQIRKKLAHKIPEMTIKFEGAENILKEKSGKFRFVKNEDNKHV
jgi:phenylacetate-CoA ligase